MADIQNDSNEEILKAGIGVAGLAAAVLFMPAAVYGFIIWKRKDARNRSSANEIWLGTTLVILGLMLWLMFFDNHPLYWVDLIHSTRAYLFISRVLWIWWMSLAAIILFWPVLLYFKKPSNGLRTSDFLGNIKNWKKVKKIFYKGGDFPIGVDVKTSQPVVIPEIERCSHFLGIGATGSGKTTLMILMILHAIRHGLPCVIIDPKGEDSTLEEIKRVARIFGINLDRRLKVFTMSKPDKSCRYNPLKHGNANQLKDRIMEALNWSEQYYQSISGSYLTAITSCAEHLGITMTLDYVSKIMTDKSVQSELTKMLRVKIEAGDTHALELFNRMNLFFSKSKDEELSGLAAQIAILNNPTFGKLLSFEDDSLPEIDLREIRKSGGIAYFQLDTLGNGDSARRLGRMIVEDLKSLSSEIYKTEPDESKRVFFPIFIDEFGSFVSKEFIEILKQSRGSRFALHLFCQGLEDLDLVSKEFRRQVISNTLTKMSFRVDDDETVNEFCATAGTFDALEQSYQVEGKIITSKTGMGNLRETKQMRIEHDVIKNLRVGQAVVVSKSPSRAFGVQVYQSSIL